MIPISRQEGYLGKTDRSPGLKVYITISESHEQKEQPPNLQGLLFGYKEGWTKDFAKLPPPRNTTNLPSFVTHVSRPKVPRHPPNAPPRHIR